MVYEYAIMLVRECPSLYLSADAFFHTLKLACRLRLNLNIVWNTSDIEHKMSMTSKA